MHISDFDYELPEELIAQHPLPERDASRMLVLDRNSRSWQDRGFAEIPDWINSGDVLVLNNTRVFAARLVGTREGSAGRVEILLVNEIESGIWNALLRPGNRLREDAVIVFADSAVRAVVINEPGSEVRQLQFSSVSDLEALMDSQGQMPLPPYIKRPTGSEPEDRERYQTIFARERGAIAAPTAGLHFTPGILERLRLKKVQVVEITLHVGYGTFEPVRVSQVEDHSVRPELVKITAEVAETINSARRAGQQIIAVGTTTTRALESANDAEGDVTPLTAMSNLTITPGHKFRVVDAMLTNFHLPQSSLLLLVSAFAGRELTLAAYRHAVLERYRFYSYGDCMLII
jgi:S-adenosylmethionine:tRNA ribosyltransferase-isomerase